MAQTSATIRGVVQYSGALPERKKLPVTIDQYVCGKEKDAEDLVLGPQGGVLNAVVWLENPPAGAKWENRLPPRSRWTRRVCLRAARSAGAGRRYRGIPQ